MLYRSNFGLLKRIYYSYNKSTFGHNKVSLGFPKFYGKCECPPYDKDKEKTEEVPPPPPPEGAHPDVPGIIKQPETDLYKRPVRLEPSKVIFGFIPQEWNDFFMPKTGVTGFYTLLFTFGTFLISKEIYVMEHEYYSGIAMAILATGVVKLYGKQTAEWLDREIDNYHNAWNSGRTSLTKVNTESIAEEEKAQWSMEGQKILVEAKRENVGLQLETAYRQRIVKVFNEVKKRLDYQVEVQHVKNNYVQKNIVSWVLQEVNKSLSPELLDKYMNKCIDDLQVIISRHKGA